MSRFATTVAAAACVALLSACAGRNTAERCPEVAAAGLGDSGKPLPPKIVSATAVEIRWAPDGKARIDILNSGKNAFVGRLTLEAGSTFPKYVDETEEYLHIIDGKAEITINGQTWEVGPGDTIFVPAGATVSLRNWDRTMVLIQVIAGPGPAKKYDEWLSSPPPGAAPVDTLTLGTMPGT